MAFYNEFPGNRTYDGDLAWCLQHVKEIENYIKTHSSLEGLEGFAKRYATSLEMLADESIQAGMLCITAGYSAAGDTYGGIFYIAPNATPVSLITAVQGLYAHPIASKINPGQLGADASGAEDSTAILLSCMLLFDEIEISGNIRAASSVIVPAGVTIKGRSADDQITGNLSITGGNVTIECLTIDGEINANGGSGSGRFQNIRISGVTVKGGHDHGIKLEKCRRSSITNCIIANADTGLYIIGDADGSGATANADGFYVAGCVFETCRTAIRVDKLADSDIGACEIFNADLYGVRVTDSNRVQIHDCNIFGSSSHMPDVGIWLEGNEPATPLDSPYNTYINVHHNMMQIIGSAGVYVSGYNLWNKIDNNYIKDACQTQGSYNSAILVLGADDTRDVPRHTQGTSITNNVIVWNQGTSEKPSYVTYDIRTIKSAFDVVTGNMTDAGGIMIGVAYPNNALVNGNHNKNVTTFTPSVTGAELGSNNCWYRLHDDFMLVHYTMTLTHDGSTDPVVVSLPFEVDRNLVIGSYHNVNSSQIGSVAPAASAPYDKLRLYNVIGSWSASAAQIMLDVVVPAIAWTDY